MRKQIYQDYYTDDDYSRVLVQLPDIIKDAEMKAAEIMEPTIKERKEVMDVVKGFIRDKKRKVYGGTAMNEVIKIISVDDAIYSEHKFSDMEFYSTSPIVDTVELCNILYDKGYKYIRGKEAQHPETYSIFVNFVLYCDITYVPSRIYNAIKTIDIEGVKYVHPHFILIDQFRMLNNPICDAVFRWEKAFKRTYLLLKHYPFEYFEKPINLPPLASDIRSYIDKIKLDMMTSDINRTCILGGFDAYNFFIGHAAKDRSAEKMARTNYSGNTNKLLGLKVQVPFVDIMSVDFSKDVVKVFRYLQSIVKDKKLLTMDQYFPLFQFYGYTIVINYKNTPLVRLYDNSNKCIPNLLTTKGYMYVSYQFLLMTFMMNKFKAHIEKDKNMYFNYGIAISNLIKARNMYLTKNDLGVINNSVFGEFKVSCVGNPENPIRESFLRIYKRIGKGKLPQFTYEPERFFEKTKEAQEKFSPEKCVYRNTSGNKIYNSKNYIFKCDENCNIIESTEGDDYTEQSEPQRDEDIPDPSDTNGSTDITTDTTGTNRSTDVTTNTTDTNTAYNNSRVRIKNGRRHKKANVPTREVDSDSDSDSDDTD